MKILLQLLLLNDGIGEQLLLELSFGKSISIASHHFVMGVICVLNCPGFISWPFDVSPLNLISGPLMSKYGIYLWRFVPLDLLLVEHILSLFLGALLRLLHLFNVVMFSFILLFLLSLSPGLNSLTLIGVVDLVTFLVKYRLLLFMIHDVWFLDERVRELGRRHRVVRIVPVDLAARLQRWVHQDCFENFLLFSSCDQLWQLFGIGRVLIAISFLLS